MKVGLQRAVDRRVGTALCALTSLRARLLPRPTGEGEIRHIVVILLSEMGSLVLARPMFDRLRALYPGAELHALVFAPNREVLDLQEVMPPENVHALRNDTLLHLLADARRAAKALRRLPVDVSVDCELFARVSALLAWQSGARIRVGFHPHTQEGLYRGSFLNRPVPYNPYQHIAQNFVTLAEAVGGAGMPVVKREVEERPPVLPRLAVPEEEGRALEVRLLADHPGLLGRRLVLLSPAGGLLPIRAWPLEHYAELLRRLAADGLAVGIVGLPRDRETARRLLDRAGSKDGSRGPVVDLTGWTRSVRELLLLFGRASLLVTNDGGPGHFAALSPMPAIVLFGPETPRLYGTLDEKSVNLRTNLSCSPCLTAYNHRTSPCDGNNVCLQLISPESVHALARELLARHPAPPLGARAGGDGTAPAR